MLKTTVDKPKFHQVIVKISSFLNTFYRNSHFLLLSSVVVRNFYTFA